MDGPAPHARSLLEKLERHLESNEVARVVYGAIIGLALVVALETHPPGAGAMVATLLGTGLAVALAEVYSEVLGAEVREHTRAPAARVRAIWRDAAAVVFGITFPSVFFLLSAAGATDLDTAFALAKWSGLGLTGFYGFCAGRLAGARLTVAFAQGIAVALVGAFLIGLKALVH